MKLNDFRTNQQSFQEQPEDPEFRAGWERTVFAREMVVLVVEFRTKHNL